MEVVISIWQNLLVMAGGNLIFFSLQVWYFHWSRRAVIPDDLHKEIKQLSKDLVAVRGQVKYLEGRINGKEWKRSET